MKHLFFLYLIGLTTLSYAQCIEGDCINGYGKYTCDCGYVFEGEFVDGERVSGILTKSDLVYTGEFKNELAHGFGTIKYKDGSWYEGTFSENIPEGYGSYYFSNGQRYIGELVNGSFEGLGVQFATDGGGSVIETEIGHFYSDQLSDWACSISINKDIYFGKYKEGDYLGFGLYIFSSDHSAEAGEFKKKKLYENGLLMDYPKVGELGVKGYSINDQTYDLKADIQGNRIEMIETSLGVVSRIMIFDQVKQWLFISNVGSNSEGRLITLEGKIFDATLDTEKGMSVEIGVELYKR